MKELECRDAGFDCDAVVRAESEHEVMADAAAHLRDVHGMTEIDDTTANHLRSQIRDAA